MDAEQKSNAYCTSPKIIMSVRLLLCFPCCIHSLEKRACPKRKRCRVDFCLYSLLYPVRTYSIFCVVAAPGSYVQRLFCSWRSLLDPYMCAYVSRARGCCFACSVNLRFGQDSGRFWGFRHDVFFRAPVLRPAARQDVQVRHEKFIRRKQKIGTRAYMYIYVCRPAVFFLCLFNCNFNSILVLARICYMSWLLNVLKLPPCCPIHEFTPWAIIYVLLHII